MNILCIIPDAGLGGAEKVFLNVARVWHTDGHQLTIVIPKRFQHGPLIAQLPQGVNVKHVTGMLTLQSPIWWKRIIKHLWAPITYLQLKRYMRQAHAQLIYTNTIQITLGARLAWNNYLPHLWHIHEMPDFLPLFGFQDRSKRTFKRLLTKSIDLFICQTQLQRWEQFLQTTLPSKRVVYNPCETTYTTHPKSNIVRFGYAGQFAQRKRTKNLVTVFKQLQQQHPNIHLTLLGAMPEDKKTDYLSNGINVENFTSKPSKFYDSIDIFVLPSITEVWPLTILEATTHGCACICTNNCGLPELLQHQQDILFVPPTDQQLYHAMEQLLDDQYREQLVRHAQAQLQDFQKKHNFYDDISQCVTYFS